MKILTVAQAAEFLQISGDVLYPMIARGDIPAAKVRGQWRLIDDDLVEWLRSKYSAPAVPNPCPPHFAYERPQTESSIRPEYARLLGLGTKSKRGVLSKTQGAKLKVAPADEK